jgi:hypothetical protein
MRQSQKSVSLYDLSLNPSPKGEGLIQRILLYFVLKNRANKINIIELAPPPWGWGWGEVIIRNQSRK